MSNRTLVDLIHHNLLVFSVKLSKTKDDVVTARYQLYDNYEALLRFKNSCALLNEWSGLLLNFEVYCHLKDLLKG